MNPFVNPKKRGVSLPSGCKDLIDVLQRRESGHDSAVRRFILWVIADNANAIKKYQHYGYTPDGLVDCVLANERVRL